MSDIPDEFKVLSDSDSEYKEGQIPYYFPKPDKDKTNRKNIPFIDYKIEYEKYYRLDNFTKYIDESSTDENFAEMSSEELLE